MTDELKVTPGEEFRAMREHGVTQRLYGGRVVRLRTVTPDRLLRLGKIPDILTPVIIKMFYEGYSPTELDKLLDPRETVEEILQQIESLRVVCTAGLVDPRIVDNPQAPDEISFDDLTPIERGWIFKLVLLEAENLLDFRQRQAPDVEVVQDNQDNSEPAQ